MFTEKALYSVKTDDPVVDCIIYAVSIKYFERIEFNVMYFLTQK